jgi:PIN domain nuclease of toxin-antitoxin system
MKTKPVLLDTHIWLWLIQGDSTLSLQARRLIDDASENQVLFVSVISIWEIAMLESKNKIKLESSCHTWVKTAFSLPGIELLTLTPDIAIESCNLPGQFHGDPADRILAATARTENLHLMTRDKKLQIYSTKNFINVIKA